MGIGLIGAIIAAGLAGLLLNGRWKLMWGGLIGLAVLIAEILVSITFMVIFWMLYVDVASGTGFHEILKTITGEIWNDFSGVAALVMFVIPVLYFGAGFGAFWVGQRAKFRRAEAVQ